MLLDLFEERVFRAKNEKGHEGICSASVLLMTLGGLTFIVFSREQFLELLPFLQERGLSMEEGCLLTRKVAGTNIPEEQPETLCIECAKRLAGARILPSTLGVSLNPAKKKRECLWRRVE